MEVDHLNVAVVIFSLFVNKCLGNYIFFCTHKLLKPKKSEEYFGLVYTNHKSFSRTRTKIVCRPRMERRPEGETSSRWSLLYFTSLTRMLNYTLQSMTYFGYLNMVDIIAVLILMKSCLKLRFLFLKRPHLCAQGRCFFVSKHH